MSTVVYGKPIPEADQVCTRCLRRTITRLRWLAATPEQRAAWAAVGVAKREGRGLCGGCYRWARVNGRLVDYERTNARLAELLEEWEHMADPTRPVLEEVRRLAPRLGMEQKTLETALYRGGVRSRFHGGCGERRKVA